MNYFEFPAFFVGLVQYRKSAENSKLSKNLQIFDFSHQKYLKLPFRQWTKSSICILAPKIFKLKIRKKCGKFWWPLKKAKQKKKAVLIDIFDGSSSIVTNNPIMKSENWDHLQFSISRGCRFISESRDSTSSFVSLLFHKRWFSV